MSRQLALDAINLKPTPRPGHTEYSIAGVKTVISKTLGIPADQLPEDAARRFHDAWDYDFLWTVNDGPVPWGKRGRVTDMGHAVYAEGGVDKRETLHCPFTDVEEVLSFNAVEEYGLPDLDELTDYYENWYQNLKKNMPNQLAPGGYYKSVVSGAIETFGWDMLLMGAASPDRFARVLSSFADLTLHHARAWARTSIDVYLQHDDMVWTDGPFMAPAFYREAIFPQYKRIWEVIKNAGKKILYCSDGRFDMFMDDIAKCGADGFIFEPCNPFEDVVERFGQTHCLVGSAVDCRTLTFNSWEDVKAEMDRTLACIPRCKGLILAVGNHMPSNIPVEMAMNYIRYYQENWTPKPIPV